MKKQKRKGIYKKCEKCNKRFIAYSWNIDKGGGRFCSHECRKTSEKRSCIVCDKEFVATKCNIDRGGGKYCSHRCQCLGKNNPFWHGGKTLHERGYILIRTPNHPNANMRGYVSEHRLVIEKKIGRHLSSQEVVHHINGIKDDNRLENLELFANHGLHLRKEWKEGAYTNR